MLEAANNHSFLERKHLCRLSSACQRCCCRAMGIWKRMSQKLPRAKLCSVEGQERPAGNSSWVEWALASRILHSVNSTSGVHAVVIPPKYKCLFPHFQAFLSGKIAKLKMFLTDSLSGTRVPSCPFPSQVPHSFLTIIPSTYRIPGL